MHVPSIGIKSKNIDDLIIKVKKGLPASSFEKLRKKLGVSDNFLSQIVNIPKRTLSRRKQQGKFNAHESEKVLRIARMYDRALEVFEDQQAAEKWLKEPARRPQAACRTVRFFCSRELWRFLSLIASVAVTRVSGNRDKKRFSKRKFLRILGFYFRPRPVAETLSKQAIAQAPILSIQKIQPDLS